MNKEKFNKVIAQLELDDTQLNILKNINVQDSVDDEEFETITIQLELSPRQDEILESIGLNWNSDGELV